MPKWEKAGSFGSSTASWCHGPPGQHRWSYRAECSHGAGARRGVTARGSVILSQRSRFHLVYRLTGRTIEALAAHRAGRGRAALPRVLLCMATDVVGAGLLRRSSRFHLGLRLAADAADAVLWSDEPRLAEPAVLPGVPLAMESGLRLGAAGLIVPAVNAVAVSLAARTKGRRASLAPFRWQVSGVVLGIALAAYQDQRHRVEKLRHEQHLEAKLELSHLAGQHEIAMAADSVFDLICRTTPLLAASGCDRVPGQMLAGWKQALAEGTSARATYLGVFMARWEQSRNATHHDLRADVVSVVENGAGTLLLSSRQAQYLEQALDELPLRGRVTVSVRGTETMWNLGEARLLEVNGIPLEIPADKRADVMPFDPGPFAFLSAAMWALDSLGGETGADPLLVVPVAAAQVGLAWWAHLTIRHAGPAAHRRIVWLALASGLLQTIVTSASMQPMADSTRIQRFPCLPAANVAVMLLSLYEEDLTRRERNISAGIILSTLAVGVALQPKPIVWVDFLSGTLWSVATSIAMAATPAMFTQDADALANELRQDDDLRSRKAFTSGRKLLVRMIEETQSETRRGMADSSDQLPDNLSVELVRRMAEIDRRIEELRCLHAS